jgi:hypothetical protein
VTGVLLTALGATMLLAAKALPEDQSPLRAPHDAAKVVHDITVELQTAVSVTSRADKSITFTVADRTGDAVEETIRYGWSGATGGPLTRRYNAGTVVSVLPHVTEFSLSYSVETVVGESTTVYLLKQVRMSLNLTDDPATRIETAVAVLNEPEVTSP